MNLKRYPFQSKNDFREYYFNSNGPKGKIRKSVVYSVLQEDPLVYNLAFGDEDANTGKIIDNVISNNDDRDFVLATVASTIHSFCDRYGNQFVYVTGSSASRTRLYQINIGRLYDEISIDFDIYGDTGREIVSFERNVNYQGFLVRRK